MGDILIIIAIVIAVLVVGLYFLNKWAYQKMDTQQALIDKTKAPATIYVIDKKKEKITNVNMPKGVIESMPKMYRFMKLYFVQAKIGPQIATLMCDKKVFNAIPTKKQIKVELAGMYIVSVAGMKSDAELKEIKKAKKKKASEEKKKK